MSRGLRCCVLPSAIFFGASPAQAANPSKVECVTANEAAQTLIQSGKLIEAEGKLATCVIASCPVLVRADCAERLSEIDRVMPSITFELRDSEGNRVPAARVTMDGQALPEALGARPVRVDPGEHRFLFEAEGLPLAEGTFLLHQGEKSRKETIVFAAAPTKVPAVAIGSVVQPQSKAGLEAAGQAKQEASPSSAAIPTLAYVAAGVGAVGLALGIGAGVAADSKHAALEGECGPGSVCALGVQSDIDDFHALRAWSTVGYVLAAAGLAGGAILWLTGPKSSNHVSARVWIGPRTAGFAGTF